VAAVASPIPVLVPVTTAIAMFAPLGLIKGFDDTWNFPETATLTLLLRHQR
jgi:hypothetical protein